MNEQGTSAFASLQRQVERLAHHSATLKQQQQVQGDLPGLAQQPGDAVQRLADVAARMTRGRATFSFVDTKGRGNPAIFQNDETKFMEWRCKTCACLFTICGEQFRGLLDGSKTKRRALRLSRRRCGTRTSWKTPASST